MVLFEKAPAKINLSLDVLAKRNDGFHDVEMVMTTIDLFDRIEIIPLREDQIHVSIENRFVPKDERNLAYKAAKLIKNEYNVSLGVHIKIDKNIPVSAGLGGGSSNAAAVLRGLNKLWSLNISTQKLAKIGLEIGSDVPFFVYNTTALVKGRGEIVTPLPKLPHCWVVLAKPDIGVSTKTIFQKVNIQMLSHLHVDEVVRGIYEQDLNKIRSSVGNVLEKVTCNLYPEMRQIKEKMFQLGAPHALMSGSGPTVFALFNKEKRAKRIYNGMRGFCKDVYIVRTLGG